MGEPWEKGVTVHPHDIELLVERGLKGSFSVATVNPDAEVIKLDKDAET